MPYVRNFTSISVVREGHGVSDVKMSDEDVLCTVKNTLMKEHIWINRVASEFVFQLAWRSNV